MSDCPKCGTRGEHEQVRVDLEGRVQIQHGCMNEGCQHLWLEDARDESAVLALASKWAGFGKTNLPVQVEGFLQDQVTTAGCDCDDNSGMATSHSWGCTKARSKRAKDLLEKFATREPEPRTTLDERGPA